MAASAASPNAVGGARQELASAFAAVLQLDFA